MHERGIVEDLIRHAESLCADHSEGASRINLTVGALSGVDPRHISEYMRLLTRDGSPLAGVEVFVEMSDDITDPGAGSVRIDSMTFEDE
jgi:Zn finger protein HypA/HybF involved in hydrogenase expression